MSEIGHAFVKQGMWVDLEKSSSMGRTITTDTRTGTFVVALIAILCSLATAHLWHLITFGIHQSRADGRPSDGFFRQQQAILRGFPSPSTVVADYVKLHWYWRPWKTHHNIARSIVVPLLAASFTAVTVIAGVFSSYIVDTTNLQVLAHSSSCGPINLTEDTWMGVTANYTPIIQSLSEPLTQDCYDAESNAARCNIYTKPRIPFKVDRSDCPWPSSMCVGQAQPAVVMDSGVLDLNDAFGLNLPSSDRVQFRKKTTCAVLPMENRTMLIPATAYPGYSRPPLPQEQMMIYNFGDMGGNGTWNNATFVVSLALTNVTDSFTLRKFASYTSPEWDYKGVLNPLPEMKRDDADLVLKLVVKNRVAYDTPVNDPVFSAHKNFTTFDESDGESVTFFFPDTPASIVGCIQQYQFCTGNEQCTQLSYLPRQLTGAQFPHASSLQLAVLQLLLTSAFTFDISSAQTLRASSLIRINGYINELPNDQWVTEVVGWESNAWASLQIATGDYATGIKARDAFADSYTKLPATDGERGLCEMQKMKISGGFVNINVFGLAFVTTFALLVVVLDIALLRFLVFLSGFRRMRWLGPRIERWIQDGVLQLQRRAYESDGQGHWKGADREVPITTTAVELHDLPAGDNYVVQRRETGDTVVEKKSDVRMVEKT